MLRWVAIGLLAAGCPSADFRDAGTWRPNPPDQDAGPDSGLGDSGFSDSGVTDSGVPDAGQPVSAEVAAVRVVDFGVFIELTLDGQGPFLLRYDTGSPTTYVDRTHAQRLGISTGMHVAALGSIDLGVRRVTLIDWLEASYTYSGLPGPILGLAGNDLFTGKAVGLDYRDRRMWIMTAPPPASRLAAPQGTGSAVFADFTVNQGYLFVGCRFADAGPEVACLFDTGAVYTLTFERHWADLPHPDPRRVPRFTYDNQRNPLQGYSQRAEAVRLGGLGVRGDVVDVYSQFGLLTRLEQQLGRTIAGLVGFSSTLGHYTVIDYANARLAFFPYEPVAPLFPSPYLGYGFIVGNADTTTLGVLAVVSSSDAEARGVRAGDRLVRVDGVPLGSAQVAYTTAALIGGAPGTQRRFEFSRDGGTYAVQLTAEDLLPPVP